MLNSLGKTKTDNWSRCGEKRESETSYHGRMLRMKRKGYLIFTRLAEMLHTKITKMESRKTTKKQIGMKQTPTTKSSSGEEDLTQLWLIGPSRSCSYWNSSSSDQRRDYRERGESRARVQHDILIRSLEKVTGEEKGENEGWKIKLIIFVGGTSGSVNLQIFNDNLITLQILESKRNAIRKGLVHELLNAQDTVLCSYLAQRPLIGGCGAGGTLATLPCLK
jgi:hypothetical protein